MRTFLSIIAILTFHNCYSQELDIFQNDSLYSKNKISSRTMYSVNGSTLQKELVTHYNPAGQKIKQFWYWNGEKDFHNVETFYYSNNRQFVSLIDSSADGSIETTNYNYENSVLKSQVTLNEVHDTTDFRFYPERNITIKRWYANGKPYRFDTTIFERENIKSEYYGIDNSDSLNWHYKFSNDFDSNGNLIKVSAKVQKPYNSFTRYIYDDRNLLIKKQEVFFLKRKEAVQTEYYFTYE